jgi:hypothetical protein
LLADAEKIQFLPTACPRESGFTNRYDYALQTLKDVPLVGLMLQKSEFQADFEAATKEILKGIG